MLPAAIIIGTLVIATTVAAYLIRRRGRSRPSIQIPQPPPSKLPDQGTTRPFPRPSITQAPGKAQTATQPQIVADDREARLYQNLLRKALGDRAKVERLIQLEARRSPSASRADLLQSAIEQWEQDNR